MASNPEQQQTQQSQPQGDLASDPRVHFDQQKQKWCFEDDDGNEMEWDANRNSWVPVVSLAHSDEVKPCMQCCQLADMRNSILHRLP